MKHALLIFGPRGDAPRLDSNAFAAFVERVKASGAYRGSRLFQPALAATSVRSRDGEPVVTAGPANPGEDPVLAFVVIEGDEAQAMALAQDAPVPEGGSVEVRATAAPGSGGSDRSALALNDSVPGHGRAEFAFLINVADEKRPWPGDPKFTDLMERCGRVLSALEAKQAFKGTERLAPNATGKRIRPGGHSAVTDGPFAEARELIGGFILGECDSMEEAIALATNIPGAVSGSVEIRQVIPLGAAPAK